MPQYCFRIIDHETGFPDEVYQYCEDVAEAVALAETIARELVADDAYCGGCTVIVTDRKGPELVRVPSILPGFSTHRMITSMSHHRLH
jgi:hypothetical protein